LPYGVFELHKETSANPDLIFDNVSSNVFNYTDVNTSPDTVYAYWITVPLNVCDTSRAASAKTNSNIVRRDIITIPGMKPINKGLSIFDIIPNPNNGSFMLSLKHDFKNQISVDIISSMGTTVWSNTLPSGKEKLIVDLPQLNQGVYLIQVTENNKKQYKKMIVNK